MKLPGLEEVWRPGTGQVVPEPAAMAVADSPFGSPAGVAWEIVPVIPPDCCLVCGTPLMMTVLWMLAVALWAAGFLLWPRLRRARVAARPSLDEDDNQNGCLPSLSVVIPARNEAGNLPALLGSLAAQSVLPDEVIVVDDGSTDGTAAVARGHGATVIASRPLPDGWRGKPWACHQGAEVACGDLLCFVDADTWFAEPDGLRQLLASRPGGAFSLCPWHAVRRPYEHLSLFFNLNMALGTVPDGLFGQLLLIDRQSYARVGGHGRVRGLVLENFRLAAHCREAGVAVGSACGRGILSFRMYPGGLADLVEGWTKGFASGAGRTPGLLLALIIAWLTGLMLAAIGVPAGGFATEWLALYLACALQVGCMARRIGGFRWWSALAFPLPLAFFFALFARSARRAGRPVTWKGREIHADD